MNRINKIYLFVAILITAAIAHKLFRYESWNRYYYAASVCAPEIFPVYVREAYFITAHNNNIPIDTEAVNGFNGSWRSDNFFPEATEPNLVPRKLVLKYASYREGSFYNDTILLPEEKIKAVFDATLKSNSGAEIYYRGQRKPGLSFMTGIANNGNIILWARDKNGETEIVRKKIYAREPTENDTYFGEKMTRQAYLKDRFSLLNDSLRTLINTGFDANASYIDSSSNY